MGVPVTLWIVRLVVAGGFTLAAYILTPFDLAPAIGALLALGLAFVIIFIELSLRTLPTSTLLAGAMGGGIGLVVAVLINAVISDLSLLSAQTLVFLQVVNLAIFLYVGLTLGASRGGSLTFLPEPNPSSDESEEVPKILDTSVIIDGRIGDLVETGFLEGPIIIPEFILQELQSVADSPDPMKRNRGRRGLDILKRIQEKGSPAARIVEQDFPEIRQVDLKLIELAREIGGKIITNDFNLNKVAQLRGISVLNINELANALKAVVLPGEVMRVFILKEGKEYNQGVAYLDDGTMVVVDDARRLIGKTIDIEVTSVLQTTAGKMIFGKQQLHGEEGAAEGVGESQVSQM